jgi:hypothetical protein
MARRGQVEWCDYSHWQVYAINIIAVCSAGAPLRYHTSWGVFGWLWAAA